MTGFSCLKIEVGSAAAAAITSLVMRSSMSMTKPARVVVSVKAVRGS